MGDRVQRRRLTPVVGGMTVAVTAAGAVVTTTHVAPALAAPATADAMPGAAAGGAALESCEAYFGFGKEEGAVNVVEFDVADVNGDDGTDHAVPDDTDVVLVIETEDGTIECTPYEVSESDWDDAFDGEVPFPGPGHYAYPSVALEQEIGDDTTSQVTGVGFRVTTIPTEHTLESPTGTRPLTDHFVASDGPAPDPRALDVIEAGAGTAAVDAFNAAWTKCFVDEEELTEPEREDPELVAAAQALVDYLGGGDVSEVYCIGAEFAHFEVSFILGGIDTSDYVEDIRLSTPEPDPTTSSSTPSSTPAPTATEAPAAQAVTANPTFTG
jgi:hypothetical protein